MAKPRKKKVSVSGKRGDPRRVLTITVDADDETLERLSTLMLFARAPAEWEEYEEPPMPWPLGEEGKPEEETPRLTDAAVKQAITGRFTHYIQKFGVPRAQNFLADYGVKAAAELQGEALHLFYADLVKATPNYKEEVVAS